MPPGRVPRRPGYKAATDAVRRLRFYQPRLARYGELFFVWRANDCDLLKVKLTHLAEMLSAEPIQTA